ncbi:uncharacterized protein LOC122081531 [Macadamia integrifolia]|uniref:uncharacterized protein LOC122081531 n=1 Tax=Macadamia integrifolia TaxID=60698 RepID=UPI001C4FEF92|nr:uncharacterized protein LOC122081531 [Macadamia integrifolia]
MADKAQKNQMNSLVWDCGSSLYDSFELKSFENQLHSAIITSRSLSMPHSSSHPRPFQPPPRANKRSSSSSPSPSKISRSLQKLIRLVFRSKPTSTSLFKVEDGRSHSKHEFYALYDRSGSVSGGLFTIPEVPEMGFDSLSRRSVSQRFTPSTPLGVSCA